MVEGKALRQIFAGYAKQDDAMFRAGAEALIEGERAKNHRLLADDLERTLYSGNGSMSGKKRPESYLEIPIDKDRGFPLVDVTEYSYGWDRLVAPTRTITTLQRIAREHHYKDRLASGGLRPTQRLLFYGPPGCGKTLAAQVLAGVLAYPLVTVRLDAIVSSLLGETAANLRRVFEFVAQGTWVVLFDEFDAIGKDRDSPFEHGELKRVVNTLLQLMDAYRGNSVIIAATNHEGLLDEAVWRRFEDIVRFDRPTEQDRLLLLRLFLGGFDYSEIDSKAIARRLKGATGSDIELVAIQAARSALLDSRSVIIKEDMQYAIASYRERRAAAHGRDSSHASHNQEVTSQITSEIID